MDELDLLSLVRTDALPTAGTVTHHRQQLDGAIEAVARVHGADLADRVEPSDRAATGTAGIRRRFPRRHDPARRPPSRRRLVLPAAAALVVLAVLSGLVVRVGWDRSGDRTVAGGPDANAVEPSAPAQPAAPLCGTQLPVDPAVPDGYAGPTSGQGPDAVGPVGDGQLVAHWTSGTGSIEARWPAGDPQAEPDARWDATGTAGILSSTYAPEQVPSGRWSATLDVTSPELGDGSCRTIRFTMAATDHPAAQSLLNEVHNALIAPGTLLGEPMLPLVVESAAADAVPSATPCNAPAGVDAPPNRGGTVPPSAGHAGGQEALQAFLATQPTLPQTGYVELTLPDGTLAYGRPSQDGSETAGYLVVVHVVPGEAGWTVQWWESTGC